MPWRLKKQVILILLGSAITAMAVVVLILNQSASSDVLAVTAILAGAGSIVTSLPNNGNDKSA